MADYTGVQGALLSHCIDYAPFPGALAVACVRRINEAKERVEPDSDKPRPVVLSRVRPNGWWMAWGLTGNSHFRDGTRRAEAPCLDQVGLAPGYIWGGHVVQLPPEDVLGVVWAAPHELILACALHEKGLTRAMAHAIARSLHDANVENNWVWPKPETA